MQVGKSVASFAPDGLDRGEGHMPRTDKSVTILTGMIIAALYVILLIGFSRESYMRRDAAALTDGFAGARAAYNESKQMCRVETPLCAALFRDEGDRQDCMISIDAIRRVVGQPAGPLTLEGLRRALQAER